ncbi:hypothetical protein E8E13_000958 [Curvularia kusanoi]|uniref:SET domain-containing protein n=1 Tax=Curvularia kusanoi TaxID=90978 RepID=A0A9P4T4G6_CURKU|nr:hypothetical protein E8E13_000958 [Curvularia kusanoi]
MSDAEITTSEKSPINEAPAESVEDSQDRGVGAFTKTPIKRHDVLGWYSGEITPKGTTGSDYKLSLDIGKAPSKDVANHGPHSLRLERSSNGEWIAEEVTIDAKKYGNWTRFINHSCKPNTAFAAARIGSTRIMVIKALQNVDANTELTISYGEGYFRKVVCLCGAEDCLQKKKDENKRKRKDGNEQKANDGNKQKAKAGASKKG